MAAATAISAIALSLYVESEEISSFCKRSRSSASLFATWRSRVCPPRVSSRARSYRFAASRAACVVGSVTRGAGLGFPQPSRTATTASSSTKRIQSHSFRRLFTMAILTAKHSLPEPSSGFQLSSNILGNGMYLLRVWKAFLKALKDVDQHHLLAFAGSLSYYFFMSLIPFLIFLASLLAYIQIPGLFDRVLGGLSYMLPGDSMMMVRKVLTDLISTNSKGFLS